jgi:hypothetical protein
MPARDRPTAPKPVSPTPADVTELATRLRRDLVEARYCLECDAGRVIPRVNPYVTLQKVKESVHELLYSPRMAGASGWPEEVCRAIRELREGSPDTFLARKDREDKLYCLWDYDLRRFLRNTSSGDDPRWEFDARIADAALTEFERIIEVLEKAVEENADNSDESAYITFAEACKMTGLRPYELTRLCNKMGGKIRSLGKGKGRRVHSGDLARQLLERED